MSNSSLVRNLTEMRTSFEPAIAAMFYIVELYAYLLTWFETETHTSAVASCTR